LGDLCFLRTQRNDANSGIFQTSRFDRMSCLLGPFSIPSLPSPLPLPFPCGRKTNGFRAYSDGFQSVVGSTTRACPPRLAALRNLRLGKPLANKKNSLDPRRAAHSIRFCGDLVFRIPFSRVLVHDPVLIVISSLLHSKVQSVARPPNIEPGTSFR
jgi:hypothetical protein